MEVDRLSEDLAPRNAKLLDGAAKMTWTSARVVIKNACNSLDRGTLIATSMPMAVQRRSAVSLMEMELIEQW